MKHQKIYVNGMTCINCQNRIASTLQQTSGITEASVSYETGVAEITYDPEKISMEQIIARINSLDYGASTQNTSKKENIIRAVREIAIIAVIFFLLQRLGILNRLAPGKLADSEMGYGALFVIGLITSVHCIAMCGGINLSQTLSSEKNGSMFRNSLQYNIGRVISYSVIGGILGAIGGRNRIWHSDFNFLPGNAEVICRNHYGRYGNKHAGNFSGSSKTEIKHSKLWQKYNYKTSREKQNSIYNRTLQRIYAVWPITVYADRCAGFGKLSDRGGVYVLF